MFLLQINQQLERNSFATNTLERNSFAKLTCILIILSFFSRCFSKSSLVEVSLDSDDQSIIIFIYIYIVDVFLDVPRDLLHAKEQKQVALISTVTIVQVLYMFLIRSIQHDQTLLRTQLEITCTWNPKQPFINGCLVKQPFPM